MASNKKAKKVLCVYGLGVAALILIANTPFSIPCLVKLIFNIPCPGCGLTRAFVMASRLDVIGAVSTNILFLPIVIGAAAYLAAAVLDLYTKKQALDRLDRLLAKKWVIAFAAVLTASSWARNIILGM